MTLIDVDNITLALSGRTLFRELSFTLAPGERLALLGPSGVGKSSLLKLLAGIHQPIQGRVGNRAARLGYVFQEPRLLPWLTVEQNIAEVLKALGWPAKRINERITELLVQMQLENCRHSYPRQLSGGMAQRVSLARAFAIEPDLLLLDEPFSALDPALKNQLSRYLADYLDAHQPVLVYVSHSPAEVLPLVNRCLLLDSDHRHQWYPVASSADHPPIMAAFHSTELH